MQTESLTPDRLAASVWAVPPLARKSDFTLDHQANRRLITHIEGGGVSTLLYGGNAILYHVAPSEYREILELISSAAGEQTLVVPAVGPAYGTMMDQAAVLREFEFPTAMILPQREIATSSGIASGVRRFAEALGAPVVLYIKHDRILDAADVGRLMGDGLLSAIKYAVPRDDFARDDYLRQLVDAAGAERMLSGLGDQPALVHLRDFGLAGFTTGCGCVAPRLCMKLLTAIRSGDNDQAVEIQRQFAPLEDLRNEHGPITVLHAAVSLTGIAEMGPVLPLLSAVQPQLHDSIRVAAKELLNEN